MKPFDPWTATREEAQAETHRRMRDDGSDSFTVMVPWQVAQQLTADRQRIERTGGLDGVLGAVAECAMYGLAMPDWLCQAYLRRFRAVQDCHAKSWDAPEAFGMPYPPGTHIAALQKSNLARSKLANLVPLYVDLAPGLAVDWAALGRAVGVGKTEAQRLYSEAVSMGTALHVDELKALATPASRRRMAAPAKPQKIAGARRRPRR